MIRIYTKTSEEIEKEDADYAFGAAVAKSMKKDVCKTYLQRKDGKRVDTRDLTEADLMQIISKEISGFCSEKKEKTNIFDLINVIGKNKIVLSTESISTLLEMKDRYGSIMADLIGSLGDSTLGRISTARNIATFNEETKGNFEPVKTENIVAVLKQQDANEKAKQKINNTSK